MITVRQIDNAIENRLRNSLSESGYNVNRKPFLDAGDEVGYQQAKDAIVDFIEVVGHAAPKDRGLALGPRITILRTETAKGDIGYQNDFYFESVYENDELTGYNKYRISTGLYDLEYEIRFIVDRFDLDQVCTQVMAKAFKKRFFLNGVNDDLTEIEEGFYLFMNGDSVDLSSSEMIEKYYRYMAVDIDLEGLEFIEQVPKIDEIEFIVGNNDGNDYGSTTENID